MFEEENKEQASAEKPAKNIDEQWAEVLGTRVTPPPVSPQNSEQTPPPVPPSGEAPRKEPPTVIPPVKVDEPMPPSYLVWSIICCLCCCLIPAVVAVYYSSRVSSRYYVGDLEGARKCSERAQLWIIISFVLGLLSATLYLPIMLASGGSLL